MNQCRTCKHWAGPWPDSLQARCWALGLDTEMAGSDNKRVYTQPTFGCNQWVAKPGPDMQTT